MSTSPLSDTSCAVLGLVEMSEPATPYRIKQIAQASIFYFWAIPHTQIYTECARLAKAGLLDEEREKGGRRRRVYRLTGKGRKALEDWRADPQADLPALREPAVLKLFFGADPVPLAEAALDKHQGLLGFAESLDRSEMPEGMRRALEASISYEREYVRFWSTLLSEEKRKSSRRGS